MKIKINILSVLPLIVSLFLVQQPSLAEAATTVNLFQVTNDGSQQKDPLIEKNLIAYTNYGGSQGIDIWGYNLKTNRNFPILEKQGDQFLTGLYKNFIVYDDFDASHSAYHVHLYNMDKEKDMTITGGTNTQEDGVTNGEEVVYINGGACGQLTDYNLHKQITTILAAKACTPLRMAHDIVVWSTGNNVYGYNLDKTQQFTIEALTNTLSQVPNIDADANTVVWMRSTYTINAIVMEDLHSGEQKVITTSTDDINYPGVSENYVVWSDSPSPNMGSVKGYNIKTGELFDVYPQGSQQNGNIIPSIWNNTAVWMSFRTGNGDIYGASFSK